MSDREQLIARLSGGLEEVRPVVNIDRLAFGWLLLSGLYVVAVIHLFGPIRPNALQQLASEPRFLAETLCGLLAIVFTTLIAFRAAVPGALTRRFTGLGAGLLVVWIACYVIGLVSPALEPSMLGKRHGCVYETFIYAVPPVVLAFFLTRRLYPLQPVQTALAFSMAAGMMPALYMQIACMYAPDHILKFHILPGLAIALLGAAAAWAARGGWRA